MKLPNLPMSASKLVKLLLLAWMLILASAPSVAADQKSGFGLGFEKMQKIWQDFERTKDDNMSACQQDSLQG